MFVHLFFVFVIFCCWDANATHVSNDRISWFLIVIPTIYFSLYTGFFIEQISTNKRIPKWNLQKFSTILDVQALKHFPFLLSNTFAALHYKFEVGSKMFQIYGGKQVVRVRLPLKIRFSLLFSENKWMLSNISSKTD